MSKSKPVIIDVREKFEYALGHYKDAINIPLAKILKNRDPIADVSKDTPIVVYCRTGHRSGIAAKSLNKAGFTNVVNGINQNQVDSKLNG